MSSIDFFLRMLADDNLITVLYYKIYSRMKLRSSIVKSCRAYQLTVILTLIYLDKYKIDINAIIDDEYHGHQLKKSIMSVHTRTIQQILNKINEDKSLKLHKIIFENKKIDSEMITISEFNHDLFIDINDSLSICPLCIYSNSGEKIGAIVHYFTMIKCLGVMYLSSSYGSDYVSVPPKIIVIEDLSELNMFLTNLPKIKSIDNEDDFNEIRKLFVKFFLPHGRSKSYDTDTIYEEPHLKFKMLDFEKGKELEWNYIKDILYSFSVAKIVNYVVELDSLLDVKKDLCDILIHGSKSRKSRKRKSRKSKSRKRKSRKRKSRKKKSKKRTTKRKYKRKYKR